MTARKRILRDAQLRERSYALERRAKRTLLPALATVGTPVAAVLETALRRSSRRVGIALLYHSVEAVQGDPERELVPPHGTRLFEAQLRYLRQRYEVVRADELTSAARAREPGDRFPVAITFDDDLSCHVRIVASALSTHGATATFFLTGASLEGPFTFWWQRLQRAIDCGLELPPLSEDESPQPGRSIHELGREILRLTPAERDRLSAELAERLGDEPEPDGGLRSEDVRTLVAAGMSIGFHTRRHDPLPSLGDPALHEAMRAGRAELETASGSRLATIAYPHGHVDDRVASAAREAGFEYGFTTRVEPVEANTDPLLLGRIIPSYRSVGHLALQLVTTLMRRSPIQP